MRSLPTIMLLFLFALPVHAAGPTKDGLTQDLTWGLQQIFNKHLRNHTDSLELGELQSSITSTADILGKAKDPAKLSSGLLKEISLKYGPQMAAQLDSYLRTVSKEQLNHFFKRAVKTKGSHYVLFPIDGSDSKEVVQRGVLIQAVAKKISNGFVKQGARLLPRKYPMKYRLWNAIKKTPDKNLRRATPTGF